MLLDLLTHTEVLVYTPSNSMCSSQLYVFSNKLVEVEKVAPSPNHTLDWRLTGIYQGVHRHLALLDYAALLDLGFSIAKYLLYIL